MRRKTILCLCVDVTVDDIDRAVADGFDDPETIKRYTGALMGPCQGRWCSELVMAAIARRTGVDVATLRSPATRAPASPVRLGQLVAPDRDP